MYLEIGTSILVQLPNIACRTTWRRVGLFGDGDQGTEFSNVTDTSPSSNKEASTK